MPVLTEALTDMSLRRPQDPHVRMDSDKHTQQ